MTITIVTKRGRLFHLSVPYHPGLYDYKHLKNYNGWCKAQGGIVFITSVWRSANVPIYYLEKAQSKVGDIEASPEARVFPYSKMAYYIIEGGDG